MERTSGRRQERLYRTGREKAKKYLIFSRVRQAIKQELLSISLHILTKKYFDSFEALIKRQIKRKER